MSDTLTKKQVKQMLGGEWPDSGDSEDWPSGFCYDAVDYFKIEDGYLVPYTGGTPAPGPDFKLVIV